MYHQHPVEGGLGGVVGCDYQRNTNQLYFVEDLKGNLKGTVSRLDLIRPLDTMVFSGTAVMPPDSGLDLITGKVNQNPPAGHIGWDHVSPAKALNLRAYGPHYLYYLGQINFDAFTHAEPQFLPYYPRIAGQPDPGNIPGSQLKIGDLIAAYNSNPVPTNNWDYAKIRILSTGTTINVQWVTYRLKPRYQMLGSGYSNPRDIKVCSDGHTAYVTEKAGNLLQVDLRKANRVAARVIRSGLSEPRQMALDEAGNQVYLAEFANPGRLLCIDLGSGSLTVIVPNLQFPVGLVMTKDFRTAYVAEQNGVVRRIDVSTGRRETVAQGLTSPSFLAWFDSSESRILLPLLAPKNEVVLLDLSRVPAKVASVAWRLPDDPRSIAVTGPNRALICSNQAITDNEFAGFVAGDPLFLGIGHVPADHIVNGYADTTVHPVTRQPEDYFFRVLDSPFGGTLSLMINHEKARNLHAKYYQVQVDNRPPESHSWSDYKWDGKAGAFVLTPGHQDGPFFFVRQAYELWYNHWLGYSLDTTALPDGPHTLFVRIFDQNKVQIGNDSRIVQIDNTWPNAKIEKIYHHYDPGNLAVKKEIKPCETAEGTSDAFTFEIDATDPQGHLLSYAMTAMWGNNRSKEIPGETYENFLKKNPAAKPKWQGWKGEIPAPPAPAWGATVGGDTTSRQCAHTFYLAVWDRVINGWGYIHYRDYHVSITINLK